jgi:hypothetical protein
MAEPPFPRFLEDAMLMIREIMYCKPGKVRPMVEKFVAMSAVMEKKGLGKMRVMTDVSAERYWTIVAEFEVESLDTFMAMDSSPEMKELEPLMKGYHDLVDHGRREIYKVEG